MKLALAALVIFVSAALAIAVSPAWRAERPVPVVRSMTTEESKAAEATLQAFYSGIHDLSMCEKVLRDQQIFCIEGYYFSEHLERLKTYDPTKELFVEDHAPKIAGIDDGLVRALWLTALGLALGEVQADPRLAEKHFRDKKLFDLVVDGWAFQAFVKQGLERTKRFCRSVFSDETFRACEFGMGRAAFFDRKGSLRLAVLEPSFLAGLEFARTFTAFRLPTEDEARASTVSGGASLLKRAWLGEPLTGASTLAHFACMRENHITRCYE